MLMLSSVLVLLCGCSGGGGLASLPGVVQPTIVASASPTPGSPSSTGNPSGSPADPTNPVETEGSPTDNPTASEEGSPGDNPSGSPAEDSGGSGSTRPPSGSAPSAEEEPSPDPTTGFVPENLGEDPSPDMIPVDELDRLFPNLPPDPGEEGKQTLEGIDADGDGVRDDVQRWIYRRYPNDELKRKAMLRYAKTLQASIVNVDRDRPEEVRQRAIETLRANDCAYGIFGGIDQTSEERRIVDLQVLNTQERIIASLIVDTKLSGQIFNLAETICIQLTQ